MIKEETQKKMYKKIYFLKKCVWVWAFMKTRDSKARENPGKTGTVGRSAVCVLGFSTPIGVLKYNEIKAEYSAIGEVVGSSGNRRCPVN